MVDNMKTKVHLRNQQMTNHKNASTQNQSGTMDKVERPTPLEILVFEYRSDQFPQ
jgi:hypothetical protein